MDFGLTDEQEQLAAAERSWLTSHNPIARVREALDTAPITVDPEAVRHAVESGLLGLLTAEMGGTHVDLAVLSEAHGSAASSLPIADMAIAAWLLEQTGWAVDCSAQAGPAGLTGSAGGLLFGIARADDGPSGLSSPVPMAADMAGVVVVGADYCAVVETPQLVGMSTLDLTRSWARVDLDLGEGFARRFELPAATVGRVRDALAVHRGLDALGAAARLLEMTVTYAGQREQFGAPIGSFQAVKHHCANMAVGVEAGRSVLWAAALALDGAADAGASSRAASAAAAYAKAAASEVAGTALQVHGGIGFTWEHDLHLLLRRIKVDEAMDGTVAEHRRSLVSC